MEVENLVFNIRRTGDVGARGVDRLSQSLRNLHKSSQTANKGAKTLLGTIGRLAKLMILRQAIRALMKAMNEGLVNVYKFNSAIGGEMSAALDKLKSASVQTTGMIGSAFGELLATVSPILISILNLITRVADALAQVFAVLGGRSQYTKAIASSEKWAESTKKGANAAKEWKKQLLGFDVINRLEAPSDNSGGGGTDDYDGAFQLAEANSEWAKQLREITMDWFNSLNLEPLISSWDRLKTSVSEFVQVIDGALYWAYTNVLLPLAGWTVEKGLPTTLNAVASAFELISEVLVKLAPHFESFFETILQPFAEWVGDKFLSALEAITETFESLRVKVEKANSLGEFIQSLDGKEKVIVAIATAVLAVSAAIATFSIVKGAIDLVTTAFKLLTSPIGIAIIAIGALVLVGMTLYQQFETVREKFDEVGKKFTEFKDRFKEPEYWAELGAVIVEAISTAIGAALGAILTTLGEIVGQLVSNIKTTLKEQFSKDLNGDGETTWDEIGGNILIGILTGIVNAITGIGTWIKDHVLKPMWDGFCEAFGIQSPAEEMKPIGEYVLEGVLEGIINKIKEIGLWLSLNVWIPFRDAIMSVFGIKGEGTGATEMNTFGDSIIQGLKTGVERAWSGVASWVNEVIYAPLESAFNGVIASVQSWVTTIQSMWSSFTTAADSFYNSNVGAEGLYSVYPGQYSKRAEGGFVSSGDLFMANENGSAELIGSIGGRTAVANNDQIVAAVSQGVAIAVASVMGGSRNNNGTLIMNVDGKEFFRATFNDLKSVQSEKGFSLVNG